MTLKNPFDDVPAWEDRFLNASLRLGLLRTVLIRRCCFLNMCK